MLYRKFNFDDITIERKLEFKRKNHISSWEHYSDCYDYSINRIFQKGFRRNYAFNCRARALLFLIRHSFELTLKKNLMTKGLAIPYSHEFKEIFLAFSSLDIPEKFKSAINEINLDSDGSCFRYYKDKDTGLAFFKLGDKLELSGLLEKYNGFDDDINFRKGEICETFDYQDRRIQWDLTFHLGECHSTGSIRTQYDEVIEFLIEGLLYEKYEINKVYLPLLFLIRHSLELGLKSNLIEATRLSPDKVPKKKYESIHSLSQLYNCFGGTSGYLSKLDLTKISSETEKQLNEYKREYEKLNEVVHQLDTSSMYFRFPVDTNGKHHPLYISNNGLKNILKLYYLTDPFLSFTLDVLRDEGVSL